MEKHMNIGELIKFLRKSTGMSQEEFAKFLNMKQPNVSLMENNDRGLTAEDFIKICEMTNINPMNFVSGSQKIITMSEKDVAFIEEAKLFFDNLSKQIQIINQSITITTGDVSIGNDTNVIIGKGSIKK